MKKKVTDSDRMLDEYDFRGGVRGKYIGQLRHGCNLVLLEPDVAAVFRNSKAVNRALRGVMQRAARERRGKTPASR